jgi:3-hydroxyacyl-[acyl-carrier-protein] dehydratase
MSFLHNTHFYKVNSQTSIENKLIYTIQLNKAHKIFEGHFPNSPITPGACTLQIVKELIELNTENSLMLSKASNIKFIAVIDPLINDVVEYQISYKMVENSLQTNATILQNNTPICKISGSYLVLN